MAAGSVPAAIQGLKQELETDWFTIDGGGTTSEGGVYSVSGTIGQPGLASGVSSAVFSSAKV